MLVAVAVIALGLPHGVLAQQALEPEQRMAALINQARIAQGLSALSLSPELTTAAQLHARDMAAKGYMEHENLAGLTPQQRAAKQGYVAPAGTAWLVLEVITARATAEAGLNWLLSDRQHRGVVLRGYWREFGIGFAEGGPWGQIWSVKFGCRPNVLPVVPEPNANGGQLLRFTNEECSPGGGIGQIGRATEVMVSSRNDFEGAAWEPYASTRAVQDGSNVFVKLRDAKGREVVQTSGNGVSLSTLTTSDGPLNPALLTGTAAPVETSAPSGGATPATSPAQPSILNSGASSNFIIGGDAGR